MKMKKRNRNFREILAALKEFITGILVYDTRNIRALETYLHFIDLSFEETDIVRESTGSS